MGSLPHPVYQFAWAHCCRCFGGEAAFGCNVRLRRPFHGFPVLAAWPGVIVLEADPAPARPTILFSTDPEMDPERIYHTDRDRFQSEFNFRDAKQHLGLAACQARPADRHPFHVNAVLAALAWTWLERHPAARGAQARFSMANVKLQAFLERVLARLFAWDGLDRILPKYPEALQALGQIEPQPT